MGGEVLSPKTFVWSDVAAEVSTCLVHSCRRSLLPSTVFSVLVSVVTWHAPVGVRINHLSKAREPCLSSSKYCLCRTATPFAWCP